MGQLFFKGFDFRYVIFLNEINFLPGTRTREQIIQIVSVKKRTKLVLFSHAIHILDD